LLSGLHLGYYKSNRHVAIVEKELHLYSGFGRFGSELQKRGGGRATA
jgi:hypothetical protein